MRKLYLEIPYLNPKLEIICENDKMARYLYYMFSPYMFYCPNELMEYTRIAFSKNSSNKLLIICGEKQRVSDEGYISFLQNYLLQNSYTEKEFLTLHGACVAVDEQAFLFLGDSKVGKSTLTAFLCSKNFDYVTDDRIIVDTEHKTIIPFIKPIMLRTKGKEVLKNEYGLDIETTQLRCGKICREIMYPVMLKKDATPIKCIYILSRKENGNLIRTEIRREDRIKELIAYNLAIKDLKKVKELIQLSEVKMEKVSYSNLNEIYELLKL